MNIERKLQINLAILVATGAVLLGAALEVFVISALGVLSAALALVFTDIRRTFRLNRTIANVVALAAVAVVLINFLATNSRNQLHAIANLLICLQIVLLFQAKTPRTYGHLAVLSLLQVVVASAAQVNLEFGFLLLLYMVFAVSFLALLFIYGTIRRLAPSTLKVDRDRTAARPPAQSAVSATPLSVLFGQPPRAQFIYRDEEFSHQLAGWRLPRQLTALCVSTLMFSVVLFLSLPRVREGLPIAMEDERRVGMPSTEISLDEMTNILTNDELVMRVEFSDPDSGEPVEVFGDLYLRGTVLERYSVNQNGRHLWSSALDDVAKQLLPAPDDTSGVVMRVTMQSFEGPTLFSVYPAYRLTEATGRISYDPGVKRLLRAMNESSASRGPFRYELFTTGIQQGIQRSVIPHELGTLQRLRSSSRDRLAEEIQTLSYINRAKFPHVSGLADKVVAEVKDLEPNADRAQIARALQNHFLYGSYTYTLDFGQVERTAGMDPIEDFVSNNRAGHCEYFAGALVLALRSQGIPARMVLGYHDGEYNSIGNFYEIRQNHTHAWVEAYLRPEDVSESQLPPEEVLFGAWLRLDPTPGSSEDATWENSSGLMTTANEVYGFARLMWMDYVVNLNAQRQEKVIFEPLARGERRAQDLFSADSDRSRNRRSSREARVELANLWKLGVGLAILLIAAVLLYYFLRRYKFRWFNRDEKKPSDARHGRRGPVVPFYQRLTELLAQRQLERTASQTQIEFASAVGGRLAVTPGLSDCAAIPRRIAEVFYDVRFGGRQLSDGELSEVESALDEFEAALVRAERAASPSTPPSRSDDGR